MPVSIPVVAGITLASLALVAVASLAASAAAEPETGAHATPARHAIALGLAGYSPVSYIEKKRAEPGSPRFSAEHEGVTYFFTSGEQRKTFLASPERFLPAYGGYCAFGCSVESRFVPDPNSFEIIDGRLHLFLKNEEVDARTLWNKEKLPEVKAKADSYWRETSSN